MVKRIGTAIRKARSKLTKPVRQRGKISLTKYFASYKDGDRVLLKAEPAVQKGRYPMSYHGKSGIVAAKRGECYEVDIKDGRKAKRVIVHPVHLIKEGN